jgi:hypothetical protein
MKTNISNRDWELLSEYIDKQLSPPKQSKLELRMQQEPELRAAFEDLRRTRSILRSAPKMKAPRNFTLKPHMVPERKTRRAYPFFQFATAMAAVLLVLAFAGEMFTGIESPFTMEAPPPAAPAGVPEMMEFEGLVEEAVEGESLELVPKSSGEETDMAPSIASVPEEEIPPSEGPVSEDHAEEMRLLAEPEIHDPEAALGATDTSETSDTAEAAAYQEDTFMGLSLWRLLQISLAVIAVGSGFAALYFRRIA